MKDVQYCTYMFLCINHLHSEEELYLALLFGKCLLSPSSLQHNGFILKFSLLMIVRAVRAPKGVNHAGWSTSMKFCMDAG